MAAVRRLLDAGAETECRLIDLPVRVDWTPLHRAAAGGHDDVVRLLLAEGADIHAEGWCGETPLHVAARYGHAVVVGTLLANGADVDRVETDNYCTPLLYAVYGGHLRATEALLSSGADPNVSGNFGRPLSMAIRTGRRDMEALLRRHGAR